MEAPVSSHSESVLSHAPNTKKPADWQAFLTIHRVPARRIANLSISTQPILGQMIGHAPYHLGHINQLKR
jgi:hypothetical protein